VCVIDGEPMRIRREGEKLMGLIGPVPRIDEQSLAITALGGVKAFKPLVDYLSHLMVYSIFPDTLREPQKFDSVRPMARHGENWVSVLRDMVKHSSGKDIVTGLSKLTGDIEQVKVTPAAGYLVPESCMKS
jgi:hypothetical protein